MNKYNFTHISSQIEKSISNLTDWIDNNTDVALIILVFMVLLFIASLSVGFLSKIYLTKLYRKYHVPLKQWYRLRIGFLLVIAINWVGFLIVLMGSGLYSNNFDKIVGFISASLFFLIIYFCMPILNHAMTQSHSGQQQTLRPYIYKIFYLLWLVFGITTFLDIIGVKIAPILAGFGFLSLSVALAAQDLVRNWLAGINIISEKLFTVGDTISISNIAEGRVEEISFRTTIIRDKFDNQVIVPNSVIFVNSLVNSERSRKKAINWRLSLDPETSLVKIKDIWHELHELLTKNKDVIAQRDDYKPSISVTGLDNGIVMEINFFFKDKNNWEHESARFAELINDIIHKNSAKLIVFTHV